VMIRRKTMILEVGTYRLDPGQADEFMRVS
jgi:hypothetical protein